jgi:hypothetical protein
MNAPSVIAIGLVEFSISVKAGFRMFLSWLIGFLAKGLKDRQDRLAFWMRNGLARFDHLEDFQPQVPTR